MHACMFYAPGPLPQQVATVALVFPSSTTVVVVTVVAANCSAQVSWKLTCCNGKFSIIFDPENRPSQKDPKGK